MARKPRDYKAEYARRMERGRKRHWSNARSRGRRPSRTRQIKRENQSLNDRLSQAFDAFRNTRNLARSAKGEKVSPERFQLFLRDNKLARKRGKRWFLLPDNRIREDEMLTTEGWKLLRVRGFKLSSDIRKHLAAVRRYKDWDDEAALAPFVGKTITDIDGKTYEFETRLNPLLRHFKTGRGSFERPYKLLSL